MWGAPQAWLQAPVRSLNYIAWLSSSYSTSFSRKMENRIANSCVRLSHIWNVRVQEELPLTHTFLSSGDNCYYFVFNFQLSLTFQKRQSELHTEKQMQHRGHIQTSCCDHHLLKPSHKLPHMILWFDMAVQQNFEQNSHLLIPLSNTNQYVQNSQIFVASWGCFWLGFIIMEHPALWYSFLGKRLQIKAQYKLSETSGSHLGVGH